jgi:hypothetical protein
MNERTRNELSIEQLWAAPELACLAVLDTAIDMAILAVASVHPELQDQERAEPTAALRAATLVIDDARALGAAIARYRHVLRRDRDRADDLPF